MKKYLVWIIEALIWLLIIVFTIMGLFFYKNKKLKQKHSYHVFFNDANGLRNGSPVKIMGNEIGFVTQVKVINSDEIFVSFVVTKPNTNLPTGTIANIESTGLVGSRSLELYPPIKDQKHSEEMIIPQNPARISGVFTNSTNVANIIYSASTSVNKAVAVEKIPFIRKLVHDTYKEALSYPEKIDEINDAQSDALLKLQNNQKLKDFNKKLENLAK